MHRYRRLNRDVRRKKCFIHHAYIWRKRDYKSGFSLQRWKHHSILRYLQRIYDAFWESAEELTKFRKKLFDIQDKMKEKFEKELSKLLKHKYEKAKKMVEEQKKKDPFQ